MQQGVFINVFLTRLVCLCNKVVSRRNDCTKLPF